jgi:pyruvate dehydrogenase E2 component (dihydrolipoamide acetyltransferase)
MFDVTMPMFGEVMEEGTVATWRVRAGDYVAKGDLLAEIETDKAVMTLEAGVSGVVTHIVVPEGASAAVNAVLATIDET